MYDFSQYGTPSEEWLKVSSRIPAPQPNLSLVERQGFLNKQRELQSAKEMDILGPMVRTFDCIIPTQDKSHLQARFYTPANSNTTQRLPVFLFLHGGGFFSGTVDSEDSVCSRIAINTGIIVLNVCYRHTPAHTYPTAWNDTHDAFEWLHDHADELGGDPQRVLVGGISSGAYLAASFVLEKHLGRLSVSRPPIAGQVLMVPSLINIDCYERIIQKFEDPSVCSLQQNRDAPLLSMSTFRLFSDLLQIPTPNVDDLRLNPGYASTSQVVGLPPTVCAVAGLDILRDEGLLYAETLSEAGVPTDIHMFPGLPHSFAMFPELSEVQRWNRVMDEGISWILSKPIATGRFDIKLE
ncbi:Alpha/Beta hydrolase protein [Camillea tinctor]|nr:Alpha/Beta hydrolase protein [Camillea tinctor]